MIFVWWIKPQWSRKKKKRFLSCSCIFKTKRYLHFTSQISVQKLWPGSGLVQLKKKKVEPDWWSDWNWLFLFLQTRRAFTRWLRWGEIEGGETLPFLSMLENILKWKFAVFIILKSSRITRPICNENTEHSESFVFIRHTRPGKEQLKQQGQLPHQQKHPTLVDNLDENLHGMLCER